MNLLSELAHLNQIITQLVIFARPLRAKITNCISPDETKVTVVMAHIKSLLKLAPAIRTYALE